MTQRSPRIERIAYQIWWLIQDSAGECTLQDMAEFTGTSFQCCLQVCRYRGWNGRYRKMSRSCSADARSDLAEPLDGALLRLFGEAA